jgi:hypothetical protein
MAFFDSPFVSYARSSWNYLKLGHVTWFPVAMGSLTVADQKEALFEQGRRDLRHRHGFTSSFAH